MFTYSKKLIAIVFIFFAMLTSSTVHAQTPQGESSEKPIQLTNEQKAKLENLHKELLEKKKELIQQYVEYGIISKEKGDNMISRLEKHYNRMQQKGFSPHWNHSKNDHWHHEHHDNDGKDLDHESER